MTTVRWKDKAQKTALTGTEPIPITDDSDTNTDKHTTPADISAYAANPTSDDGDSLGTTSLKWSDLFLASGGTVNFNSGDVIITHGSNLLSMSGGAWHVASSVAAATAPIISENTTDDANVMALRVEGDRATPADNDAAFIGMFLSNDAEEATQIARIRWVMNDVSDGEEDAYLAFSVMVAGTLTEKVQLTGTALVPSTDDGVALGTGSAGYSDLFLASGSVVNFNNGDVTITHSSNLLTFGGDASLAGVVNFSQTGYTDIAEISTPSNPAANTARLYAFDDTGTTKLAFRDSAGSETVLGEGGGSSTFSVNTQTFTAGGTYTPTANMVYCRIRVQAPGGGGGGADGEGETAELGIASGGGGGGEYAEGFFSAATIGSSQTVTIGSVGTAGASTGGNGGAGGSVSVGALISASGGSGGTGTGSNSTSSEARAGGAGGTGGSGGHLRIPGGPGMAGRSMHAAPSGEATGSRIGGQGGHAHLGFGGVEPISFDSGGADAAGNAGQNYGGGGSGAVDNDTTGSAGGAGGAGVVIIEEYIFS